MGGIPKKRNAGWFVAGKRTQPSRSHKKRKKGDHTRKKRRTTHENSVHDLYLLGLKYLRGGDKVTARSWFKIAWERGASEDGLYGHILTTTPLKFWGEWNDREWRLNKYPRASIQSWARSQTQHSGVVNLRGLWLYKHEKYYHAVRKFTAAAAKGNVHAMHKLAICYHYGHGVDKNHTTAAHWFTMAAERGHTGSMTELGIYLCHGFGVEQDDAKAIKWFTKAVKVSWASATATDWGRVECWHWGSKKAETWHKFQLMTNMVRLGLCFFRDGDNQDQFEAFQWFTKATEIFDEYETAGYDFWRDDFDVWHVRAMSLLGYCYHLGICYIGEDNSTKAFDWYTKAAHKGDTTAMLNQGHVCHSDYTTAMLNLGHMCYSGDVTVDRDFIKALHWFTKAADAGDTRAIIDLLNARPRDIYEYNKQLDFAASRAPLHNFLPKTSPGSPGCEHLPIIV